MTQYRYIPLLRPAGFATLPPGVKWEYVEAPVRPGLADRPDLPTSVNLYGMISTDRKLTHDEMVRFDLLECEVMQSDEAFLARSAEIIDSVLDGGLVINRASSVAIAPNLYATDGLCHNSEPGTFGHECGKPARFIGKLRNGMQMGFCLDCRWHGTEAEQVKAWERIP
jgi:hypothetical protein